MTGRRAFQLAMRSRNPLDLAELHPVEELALFLGSGRAAAAVWEFARERPELLAEHPAELAAALEAFVPGVGGSKAVRAALWLHRAPASTGFNAPQP